MTPQVERLAQEIGALSCDDRQALFTAIAEQSLPSRQRQLTEEEAADEAYQRHLLAAGLISEIRLRSRDQRAFEQFTPVEITGPPLSQTIIEERR